MTSAPTDLKQLRSAPEPAVLVFDKPTKRLRIAVLNRVFAPTGGGAERYAIAMVEQLAGRHEFHVFAQKIEHQWPGVNYHKVSAPLTRPRWINQLWYATLTWWVTRTGFDIVHSHENTWHGQVQTVHVLPVRYNLFLGRSGLRKAWQWCRVLSSPRLITYLTLEGFRLAWRGHRRIIAPSPMVRDVLQITYPSCADGLSVIPPGVTLPEGNPDRHAARRALGLPESGDVVAFVANDYQKKGLETLLTALSQLDPAVALAVVGSSAQIDRFRQRAKFLGLENRVYFLGQLGDVTPLYQAADVLAHPTLEDTFAMVVLEAMAYGLPVVVSNARYCGIAGLLTDHHNALILKNPTDAVELADKLNQVLRVDTLGKSLALGSLEFASHWAWPRIALQQEAVYQDIVERR